MLIFIYNGNVAEHFILIHIHIYIFFRFRDVAMSYYFYYCHRHLRLLCATRRLDVLIINNSFIPFGVPSSTSRIFTAAISPDRRRWLLILTKNLRFAPTSDPRQPIVLLHFITSLSLRSVCIIL